MPQDLGKVLIVLGAILLVAGLLFTFSDRIPFLGRMPGDVVVKRGGFTLYFPIVTGLILSVLLTVILNLFSRR